ncbi:MAG: AsmA family protein [Leptospirales bacterium]
MGTQHRGRARVAVVVLGVFFLFIAFFEIRHSFEQDLKRDLVRSIGSGFHGRVEVGSVDLNLFWGKVSFRRVRVLFPMGDAGKEWRPLFFFPEVEGQVSLLSLLNRIYDFHDLTFHDPLVTGYIRGDQDNYRGFLEKWRQGIHPSGEGGAIVHSFRVMNARVEWGPDGKPPLVVLEKLDGSVEPNLLMDRFRIRFSSPRLAVQTGSGVISIDGFNFMGSIERGSLRDFRIRLTMKPSWFWIEGNVTRIQDRPFLDLFFHGRVDLAGIAPLMKGANKGYGGSLRTDGYVHGPVHRWNGNLLIEGKHLNVSGTNYRSASLRARFSAKRLRIHPFSAVLDSGGTISADLSANLSTVDPTAQFRVLQDRRSSSVFGDIPIQVTVRHTVRLPRRSSVFEEWLELVGKVLGPSLS